MTNKKNKFFTFCFSLIPGAGEMYLGFYKMGISLMALFSALWFIVGYLNVSSTMLFLPVIWFYSFFHVHNLNALPDEEFYALEDDWFLPMGEDNYGFKEWVEKHRKLIAGVLILFGISILWSNITGFLYDFVELLPFSNSISSFVYRSGRAIPQAVIALLIIVVGIKLIRNKKEHLDSTQDSQNSSPSFIEMKKEEESEEIR